MLMNNKKPYVIAAIIVIVLLVGTRYSWSTGKFLGRISRTVSNVRQVTNIPSTKRTLKASDVIWPEQNVEAKRMREYISKEAAYFRELGGEKDENELEIFDFPIIKPEAMQTEKNYDVFSYIESEITPSWTHAGPKGVGVISTVYSDQNDYTHLLMGSDDSGLYHSYDLGKIWEKLNFPTYHILKVAIDPSDKNHYLGNL